MANCHTPPPAPPPSHTILAAWQLEDPAAAALGGQRIGRWWPSLGIAYCCNRTYAVIVYILVLYCRYFLKLFFNGITSQKPTLVHLYLNIHSFFAFLVVFYRYMYCVLYIHIYVLYVHRYVLYVHISVLYVHIYVLYLHIYVLYVHIYVLYVHFYVLYVLCTMVSLFSCTAWWNNFFFFFLFLN